MFKENRSNLALLEKALHNISVPKGMSYQLPPNSFSKFNGVFIDYTSRSELITQFRVENDYSNPQGTVQGGILTACFDDTFGPLGVVTAQKPILTVDINIQFIRPVSLNEDFYIVTKVVSVSRSTLFMHANAFSQKGKLLAQASTNQIIIR